MTYPFSTYLAVLQQAEYDLPTFSAWPDTDHSRSAEFKHHLQTLRPERPTAKLRLIGLLARIFFWLGTRRAVTLSTRLVNLIEQPAKAWIIWQAQTKLRAAQRQGLKVIAVAGSYGKTSTKTSLAHLLATKQFTLVGRGSINTPLGLANHLLANLRSDHQVYIAEMGEYQAGDLTGLLRFLKPDVGIVTPIGFAHTARHTHPKEMTEMFQEMVNSAHSPKTLIIHAANKDILTPAESAAVTWYGPGTSWTATLTSTNPIEHTAKLGLKNQALNSPTPLVGAEQLINTLPGFILAKQWGWELDQMARALAYHPVLERRWEVQANPNGSFYIDNSYNTNPATWLESARMIRHWKLSPIAVITAGFVEMDGPTTRTAHEQLATDLIELAQTVVVIQTRFNADLIEHLTASKVTVVVVPQAQAALPALMALNTSFSAVWWEGGVRELYQ